MYINCKGNLINLNTAKVMGIINLNNDSFYPRSRITDVKLIVDKTNQMLEEGATIIDIGAVSSRPGAQLIDAHEEWKIIEPILDQLCKIPKIIISIDTVWSYTAKRAIENGAHIINDISAGSIDGLMMETVGSYNGIPYIVMHMKGTPQTMKTMNHYDDIILDMLSYFSEKIRMARSNGIKDIIIDPGFGFAKNIEQNYFLLKHLDKFKIYDLPLLCGLSRKSMLYQTLQKSVDDVLNATTVVNTIALMNEANILRVHDVKEATEACRIVRKLND